MEGERRRDCEASEAQGVRQGQARHEAIQDFENLRQSSRFCFEYSIMFFFYLPIVTQV